MKPLRFEIFQVDLPFGHAFKHAAAERHSSYSVFLKATLDNGAVGWGESLPREYVTGESRAGAFALLRDAILPRLSGKDFSSLDAVKNFLQDCDGKAPRDWVACDVPQTAAWCAVDLGLLDAYGRAASTPIRLNGDNRVSDDLRYSAVISADEGEKFERTLQMVKASGFPHVKLKVEASGSLHAARRAREVLGERCDIRADANMAWNFEDAKTAMTELAKCGITSFEQPLAAADLDGAAKLIAQTELEVMADESLHDAASLQMLIAKKACTAANIRISKCGGLVAALKRCREAHDANLTIQIGCQVGESSLLSSAHLILLSATPKVRYAEGCFGRLLLSDDPALPNLQFGHGGLAPGLPIGDGLGVKMDEEVLRKYAGEVAVVE